MTCYSVVCVEPPAAAVALALGPWVCLLAYLHWRKHMDDSGRQATLSEWSR